MEKAKLRTWYWVRSMSKGNPKFLLKNNLFRWWNGENICVLYISLKINKMIGRKKSFLLLSSLSLLLSLSKHQPFSKLVEHAVRGAQQSCAPEILLPRERASVQLFTSPSLTARISFFFVFFFFVFLLVGYHCVISNCLFIASCHVFPKKDLRVKSKTYNAVTLPASLKKGRLNLKSRQNSLPLFRQQVCTWSQLKYVHSHEVSERNC